MDKRLQLHQLLKDLIGSSNVYFQSPSTVKMEYPCIKYSRGSTGETLFANDKPYNHQVVYQVIVIDANPDSEILEKVASLSMCSFERHYTADNLNHDVYNLYY